MKAKIREILRWFHFINLVWLYEVKTNEDYEKNLNEDIIKATTQILEEAGKGILGEREIREILELYQGGAELHIATQWSFKDLAHALHTAQKEKLSGRD